MTNKKPAKKKYATYAVLLAAVPAVIFILFALIGANSLFDSKSDKFSQEMYRYYLSGWPVLSIVREFNEDPPTLLGFINPLKTSTTVDEYESDLTYIVDREREEALQNLATHRKDSARFYIKEIAQETERLENLYALVQEGFESENYTLITNSLIEIQKEIKVLTEKQDTDLAGKVEETVSSINDINTVGFYYRLNLAGYPEQASTIADGETTYTLDTYLALKDIRAAAAGELNQTIINRGGVATDGKRILITIGSQMMYLIENYKITYQMAASTGQRGHGTAAGEFQVYEKEPMAWGYYEIWMPYWITIYYSGGLANGIHGIPISPTGGRWNFWDDDVGYNPVTYGCVMPRDPDAKITYDWADIGIPVSIVY